MNEKIFQKVQAQDYIVLFYAAWSKVHGCVKLCFSTSIRVLWCHLGSLSVPLKPIFKLIAALIEGSRIISGTHHKCLLISLKAPVFVKLWAPCHHLMLCFSSRSTLSFSMEYVNVSNMALLSLLFLVLCMLLEHQCVSLASSWHQPLLLTWSSRKRLQIFYYSTCLAGGEIQLLKKTWLKHICRTLEVIQPRLPKKLCNQHPFRHREPEHKLNWCQRAKAPLASLLKVQL